MIFKKLKGKVLRACVTPACLYGLETVALTEQQKLQVCEKPDEMGRPLGKDGCRQTSREQRWKNIKDAGKGHSRDGRTA